MFGIKRTKADALFSDYVREKARWTCEYCHRYFPKGHKVGGGGLDCSHFFSRRCRSVRFDPENASALCRGCHRKLGENPALHVDFFIKRLGQKKYDELCMRAKTPMKVDEAVMVSELKNMLKELKESRFDDEEVFGKRN